MLFLQENLHLSAVYFFKEKDDKRIALFSELKPFYEFPSLADI